MLRIKVGSYTPNDPPNFEAELRRFLEQRGEISQVEGRGLEVLWARHKSSPGSNPMKIGAVLNAAPKPLSIRKLLNRLTDMTESEVRTALMRMVKNGEVAAEPQRVNGYKYFTYSLTDTGLEAWEKRVEEFESGKSVALEIWRAFKATGLKRGHRIDSKAIRRAMRSTLEDKEFWVGWRTLIASGRIDVAYNADGPGKHAHFVA